MAETWLRLVVVALAVVASSVEGRIRHYKFNVVMKNTTRLCESKPIVTVNGRFPGPTIVAREDDTLLIKVVNHVKYNVSIHWHGVRQIRTGWADGPAYITQCPIQPKGTYVYNFTLTGQRGTLWWHAHILWLRATVHGAIVILPKRGVPYPYPKPHKEVVVVLGEWWKSDTEAVINQAQKLGQAPNVSDAHTINGHPGPISNCVENGGFKVPVDQGKTYMLRIVNAALNEELFFRIAGHKLTVVEVDATYVKPFTTDTVLIAPGQTTNVLVNATQRAGKYLVAASTFMDAPIAVDNVTATASLHYSGTLSSSATKLVAPPPQNATPAHYFNISGIYTDDFPSKPLMPYNYTGTQPKNLATTNGTKLYRLPYNATVQVVLQDTAMLTPESHPLHLHGFNFFVVGRGIGNYNPVTDPKKFNLVDPVERNTVGVPAGGWTAIRFRADNPGVWFMHCHLEVHTTWGLKMAFVVDNGKGPKESILPPPSDLPKC
ncbi:putative laccase [Helianthus annuus]|nr:putative laccase [Helianthus annuus]